MFARPMPWPGVSPLSPAPVSATRTTRRPSVAIARRHGDARRRPAAGSMPCLIAFSTSVISMPGGSGMTAQRRRYVDAKAQAGAPRRVLHDRRGRRRSCAASSSSVVASRRSAGVAARRKRIRSPIRRAASGAPFSASCCALPSVLNRKCGSICDCSSLSSDSASRRDSSLRRASASRCAVERRVLAVAQVRDQRDHGHVQEGETERRHRDVAQQRAVGQPGERRTAADHLHRRDRQRRDDRTGEQAESRDAQELALQAPIAEPRRRTPAQTSANTMPLNRIAAGTKRMFHGSCDADRTRAASRRRRSRSATPASLAHEPLVERAQRRGARPPTSTRACARRSAPSVR